MLFVSRNIGMYRFMLCFNTFWFIYVVKSYEKFVYRIVKFSFSLAETVTS